MKSISIKGCEQHLIALQRRDGKCASNNLLQILHPKWNYIRGTVQLTFPARREKQEMSGNDQTNPPRGVLRGDLQQQVEIQNLKDNVNMTYAR